jgi:hypothetical protein
VSAADDVVGTVAGRAGAHGVPVTALAGSTGGEHAAPGLRVVAIGAARTSDPLAAVRAAASRSARQG